MQYGLEYSAWLIIVANFSGDFSGVGEYFLDGRLLGDLLRLLLR